MKMTKETKESKVEQKAEETVEKAEADKGVMELSAKIDKLADLLTKFVEKQVTAEEEEEKPKEEEKQEEAPAEPTPEEQCTANGGEWVDGECKMPEKPAEAPTEEKTDKADISKLVEEAVKKALATTSVKKSFVPKTVEQVTPSYTKIAKMSFAELEEQAEKYGAPRTTIRR